MYSDHNQHRYFDPSANDHSFRYRGRNTNAPLYTSSIQPGPQSLGTKLPDAVIIRLLSHCDQETLLDSALVSRRWLSLSRRVLFSAFTINSTADFRLLLLFIQTPGSTVHPDYVNHLDISFTSDDSLPSSGSSYSGNRASTHVNSSDVHQLLLLLGSVASLRADWIGARGASLSRVSTSPTSPQSLPSFLSLPHILQRLKHLEVRGGSWPFDALLQTVLFMPGLESLLMENLHEPTNIIASIPPVNPTFRLKRLSIARCTLSGESTNWLLSSSQQSLRHLTINSLRKRGGGSTFTSVLRMVGSALETLRVRNYADLGRWDAESLIASGLGFCPNLKTLVIWCDVPQSGSPNAGSGRSPSILVQSTLPPSSTGISPRSSPHHSYHSQGSSFTSRTRASSSSISRLSTSSPPYQSSNINSPYATGLGLSFSSGSDSGFNPVTSNPSSPQSISGGLPPTDGSMLPILVSIIKQGWLPRLHRLAIPRLQIDICVARVECQAELTLRGITLGDEWGTQ